MESVFYELAKEFCQYVRENIISKESLDYLIEIIMKLYVAALHLSNSEPDTVEQNDNAMPAEIRISSQVPSTYWEVYDPFEDTEVICGSFYDDLNDILRDIEKGIDEYDAGRIGNAVFEWSFGLNNHWGKHAVDLIRAMHALRTE